MSPKSLHKIRVLLEVGIGFTVSFENSGVDGDVPLLERGRGVGIVLFAKKGIDVTVPLSDITGTGASVVFERGVGARVLLSATAGNGVRTVGFDMGRGVAKATTMKPNRTDLDSMVMLTVPALESRPPR